MWSPLQRIAERARTVRPVVWFFWLLLALFLVVSLALRFRYISNTLPYPGHFDEDPISEVPFRMLQKRDANPRFFRYPSGPFYLMTASLWLGLAIELDGLKDARHLGPKVDPRGYYRKPAVVAYPKRMLAVLSILGLGALGVTAFALSRKHALAVLAPLIAACSGLYFRLSYKYLNVDIAGACFALVTVAHLAVWRLRGERASVLGNIVLSGVLAGLTVGCKYNLAPIALPCLLHVFFISSRKTLAPRVIVLGASALVGFLVSTPYAVLDYRGFYRGVSWQIGHYGGGHGAYTIEPGWPALSRYLTDLAGDLGIPVILLSLFGVFSAFRADRKTTLIVLAFPVSLVLLMVTQKVYFVRNVVSVPLFIALYAALGLDALAGVIARLATRVKVEERFPRIAPYVGVVGAGTVFLGILATRDLREVYRRSVESRKTAADWILDNVPHDTPIVLDQSLAIDPRTLARRKVSELSLCGPDAVSLETLLSEHANDVAIVYGPKREGCTNLPRGGKLFKAGHRHVERRGAILDPILAVVSLKQTRQKKARR